MKNYFTCKHIILITPLGFFFFLLLENVVIPNYNKHSKLTLTQKIEEPLSMTWVHAYRLVRGLLKWLKSDFLKTFNRDELSIRVKPP